MDTFFSLYYVDDIHIFPVFRGDRYSESADVFSFAMVVYELVTGHEPHNKSATGLPPLKYANMVAYEGYR